MFFEMVSIGIVFPVVQTILSSELITESKLFKFLNLFVKINNRNDFISILSILTIFIFFLKMVVLSFISYKQSSFIFYTQAKLSKKLFNSYLNRPYSFFISNNTSSLTKNTITVVSQVTQSLISSMVLISEVFAVIGIFIFLIYIEPIGTILVSAILILFSYIFQFFTKKKIKYYGKSFQVNEGMRILHLQQGLSAIKEIKVSNKEVFFVDAFDKYNMLSAKAAKYQQTVQSLPRYFLETIAVSSLFVLILILSHYNYTADKIVPIITIFGLSSFRLLPSFSRILNAVQSINYSKSSFEIIESNIFNTNLKLSNSENSRISLFKCIEIKNLSFSYESSSDYIFKDFSLKIPFGKSVVFVGKTGSGKSTLLDLLLGLLEPQKGEILIDNLSIKNRLYEWRNSIGFIPQNIYLFDDSILANIAFGIPKDEIIMDNVYNAIKLAQIDSFVNSLPEGLETNVGERGVKLSGGQKQRIGIARALYNNPSVLLMDEATSALDDETEKELISAINLLKGKITLIMVAHRKSIIDNCEIIIDISKLTK